MNERNIKPMQDIEAYLTPKQVNIMINQAAESKEPKRDRDMLLIYWMAYSGRRIGEILRVKVRDVIFDEGQISYNILKKKFPLRKRKAANYMLLELIKIYIFNNKMNPEDYIFRSRNNVSKPISGARVRQIVYHYVDKANLPDFKPGKHIHPHTFRHSFAVANAKKLKNPGDLVKLQRMLEHSKIDVTTFYLQFSDKDQRDMVENIYDIEQKDL